MLTFRLLDPFLLALSDQPYVRKIRALGLDPSFDYEIEVQHDPWCKALTDATYCNCDPTVHVVSGRKRE